MKTVTFDSGYHWDDPNLRWGDPSYILEPGDPGYVADPTSASFPPTHPTTKKHKMPKSDFIKHKDGEFSAQLTAFKTSIGAYATTLGVSAGQVTAQAADADYFAYVLACQQIADAHAQQRTAWKDLIRDGGTPPAAGAPVAPVFPTAVAAVAPGIEPRFRALVKQIKAHANYNTAIGEALGIEGAEQAAPDLSAIAPLITAKISGGAVQIGWDWGGNSAFLDMIELQVDRGAGYGLLAYDTTPGYTDTTPFPATAAKWKYKGIYRVGDGRVGQWSAEVSISVAQ